MAISKEKKRRNAAQLAADGFAAMVQKLGMADAVRYVQLYHQGAGDYTRERHAWLDEVSHDQIVTFMAKTEKKGTRKRKGGKAKKGIVNWYYDCQFRNIGSRHLFSPLFSPFFAQIRRW